MSAEKTPLVQKLILLVLVLNLGCVVVLVVRSWSSSPQDRTVAVDSSSAPKDLLAAERYEPLRPAPLRPSHKEAPRKAAQVQSPLPAIAVTGDAPPVATETERLVEPVLFPVQVPALVVSSPRAVVHAASVVVGRRGGEVTGTVTLLGTPPAEKLIAMDATCGRLHPQPTYTRHYVVDAESGLANVLVYLSQGVSQKYAAPEDKVLIDQTGCMFEPYIVAAQVNQRIQIRNSDPVLHNIHATPKPGSGNKEFNFAQTRRGQITDRLFSQPELFIRLKCDVHPWMFAYVSAIEHPFFAITETNGMFRFPPDIPDGRYTLTAHHLKAGSTTQEITVRPGERQTLRLQLSVPPPGYVNQLKARP